MLEELGLGAFNVSRHRTHLVRPLGENLTCCLIKQADLFVLLACSLTFLQVVSGLVQRTERVTNVFGCMCSHAQVLSEAAHLLMQVDIAFLCLCRRFTDAAKKRVSNLIDSTEIQFYPTVVRNHILDCHNLLLLQHSFLFSLVLSII